MRRGYVKLWRKSLDSGMIKNHKLWTFWTWCLMKATHQPYEYTIGYQRVNCELGQFPFGRKIASHELNMPEATIRKCLSTLVKSENLTIKSTNKYSIITILNWDSYQSREPSIEPTSKPTTEPATEPTTGHIQEHKEHKKKRNNKENLPTIESSQKKQYGDYVFLTEEEYLRLCDTFGANVTDEKIQDLDDYMGSMGLQKKYKDHNRTIRAWIRRDKKNSKSKPQEEDHLKLFKGYK